MKKIMFAIMIFIVLLMPFGSFALEKRWVKDENDNWRYKNSDGSYKTNSIERSGTEKFYLNDEGYIEKNFYLQDYKNHSYYFDSLGMMMKDTKVQITVNTRSNKPVKYSTIIVLDSQGRVIREENNVTEDMIKNNEVIEEGEVVDIYEDDVKTLKNFYKTYKVGDTISFGKYYAKYPDGFEGEENLNWTIVSVSNGLKLVSQRVFDSLGYNYKTKNSEYASSALRNWIINDFYNTSFSDVEKRIIKNGVSGDDKITILDDETYYKCIINEEPFNNMVHITLNIDIL